MITRLWLGLPRNCTEMTLLISPNEKLISTVVVVAAVAAVVAGSQLASDEMLSTRAKELSPTRSNFLRTLSISVM